MAREVSLAAARYLTPINLPFLSMLKSLTLCTSHLPDPQHSQRPRQQTHYTLKMITVEGEQVICERETGGSRGNLTGGAKSV